MICFKKLKIPYYKYTVQMVLTEAGDREVVTDFFKKNHVNNETAINKIENNLIHGYVNGAVTFTNKGLGRIIIMLYPHTNMHDLYVSIFHEIRHTVDDIADDIELEGQESVAYLQGYLGGILLTQLLDYYGASFNKTI